MTIKKNMTGLFIAQIFSYIIPLLQFPYLARVLGDELFGLSIFIISISQMAMIITDFGFDISLVKYISIKRRSNRRLGQLLYKSLLIKLLLIIPSIIFGLLIITFSGHFLNHNDVILYLLLTIFFNGFNIRWLYQGLEKSYIYARVVIVSRIIMMILIFLFVKNESDFVNYSKLLMLQSFILTSTLIYIVTFKWDVRFCKFKVSDVIPLFLDSFSFFISRVGVSFYSTGCSSFLGLFGSLQQVAIYGVAEQLYKASVQVFSPVITALTPYLTRTRDYILFRKIIIVTSILLMLGAILGFLFGDYVILFLFGNGYTNAKPVLDVFIIIICSSVLGMLYGYPALMPLGLERFANYSVYISGIFQLIFFSMFLILKFNITALLIVVSYLICDLIMSIYRIYCFYFLEKKYV